MGTAKLPPSGPSGLGLARPHKDQFQDKTRMNDEDMKFILDNYQKNRDIIGAVTERMKLEKEILTLQKAQNRSNTLR